MEQYDNGQAPDLAKVGVVGSNPIARSINLFGRYPSIAY